MKLCFPAHFSLERCRESCKMGYLCKTIAAIFCSTIIAFPLSCESPRSNFWGLPQHEYEYHVPEQLDDGLDTSSLINERVDLKKINELMDKILAEDLPHVHSVLLFKNGKLVLEEYFYGYNRNKLHSIQSCTKSITSILVGIAVDQKIIPNLNTKVYELPDRYPLPLDIKDAIQNCEVARRVFKTHEN